MSRIPVSTSHSRHLQEPVSLPSERAVSPVPSSRLNPLHPSSMSSLSSHASSPVGKKLSKRALGDEVISHSLIFFFLKCVGGRLSERYASQTGRGGVFPHFAYSIHKLWALISNDRLCAKGLRMSSLGNEPFQLLSTVAADVEANQTLPKAPWQHSNPAPRLQFRIPSPSRKQVNSVRQRGQTAFSSLTMRRD
jgi:hypothetical protein